MGMEFTWRECLWCEDVYCAVSQLRISVHKVTIREQLLNFKRSFGEMLARGDLTGCERKEFLRRGI